MGRSFTAEVLKLRKRPAPWVLALIFVVIIAISYFSTYAFARAPIGGSAGTTAEATIAQAPPPGSEATTGGTGPIPEAPAAGEEIPPEVEEQMQAEQEAFNEAFLESLYPRNLLSNVFSGGIFTVIGGTLLLILGALMVGSEYGWETFKTVLTQRPGRLGSLFGKLLAFGGALLAFVLLGLLTAAVCSFIIASLEDVTVKWPAFEEIAKGVGVGFLTMTVWGALGFALAVLLRSTAFAIGLGLIWIIIENAIIPGILFDNETFEKIRKALPGENASSLAQYFGNPLPEEFTGGFEPLVEPERAIWVLAAYAVGFILISALIIWQRDVT
ncbi:MAG: ABC transporter permease subunit [Rubrobacteraceae bacterium]